MTRDADRLIAAKTSFSAGLYGEVPDKKLTISIEHTASLLYLDGSSDSRLLFDSPVCLPGARAKAISFFQLRHS